MRIRILYKDPSKWSSEILIDYIHDVLIGCMEEISQDAIYAFVYLSGVPLQAHPPASFFPVCVPDKIAPIRHDQIGTHRDLTIAKRILIERLRLQCSKKFQYCG